MATKCCTLSTIYKHSCPNAEACLSTSFKSGPLHKNQRNFDLIKKEKNTVQLDVDSYLVIKTCLAAVPKQQIWSEPHII